MDILDKLNDRQREAVMCTEGPLLILAGAGSGKTRVLTHRIAYLMQEKNVDPMNIMAITFTNKAAAEMRERVNKIAGFGAEAVWVSTFHSACARILRRFADHIGYGTNFSIYDTDDAKTVLKQVLARMEADQKRFPPKKVLSVISSSKNHMKTAEDLIDEAKSRDQALYGEAMKLYEEELFKNNAMDFDDLLLNTVKLFKECPDVLENYQNRLRYICVDEYQDTNMVQFEMVRLLASKHQNLCVVGDDDQSIYKFRGADIRNILEFEKHFKNAHVVKLEQNYRSKGNILKAANAVIANNAKRKSKTLWTAKEDGEKIRLFRNMDAREEAAGIVRDIKIKHDKDGQGYDSFAILYRTNAQSRLLEEKLIQQNIPYQIFGGINFYARKEIKDILAYLKTIANGQDDLSVKRIINVPKRGIGATSISRVDDYARVNGLSFFEALSKAGEIPGMGRSSAKIDPFTLLVRRFRTLALEMKVTDLIKELLKDTGYQQELVDENTDESLERIENINELISKAAMYEEGTANPTLNGFLEEVALVADIDSLGDEMGRVVLMTMHSAKGLEFDNVYISGMEDGLFPSIASAFDFDEDELEEERRLCYVGMTRAMETLTLTMARERMIRGDYTTHKLSRFVEEVPEELIAETGASRTTYYEKKPDPDQAFTSRSYKEIAHRKPAVFNPKEFKVEKASSLDYNVGGRVAHKKFKNGTVLSIVDGAKDFEVTVQFDDYGVKKMFAAFAKLEKI